MKDEIVLQGIQIYAFHGVLAQEKELGQRFVVDVTLLGDFSKAARTDELARAVNYCQVYDLVVQTMTEQSFNLIEALAGELCRVLLVNLPIDEVRVKLEKTTPPIPGFHGHASVVFQRDRSWLDG